MRQHIVYTVVLILQPPLSNEGFGSRPFVGFLLMVFLGKCLKWVVKVGDGAEALASFELSRV